MKRIALFVLCLLAVATPAAAGELSERVEVDLELLSVLHQVRGMWLDPDVPEWKIDSRIDDVIDRWRGPLPDGGYEWVVRRRPATEVVSRSEQLIYGTRERLARIEEGGSWVYGVRLVVPRKRSLFRGNNSVWIEAVTIRLRSEEGEIEEDSIPLERWFEPNTSRTWEFEMIVPRADVFVEAGAEPRNRGESLLEVHFLEAIERDDPSGPYFDAIDELRQLADWMDAERIDRAIERVERRVLRGAHSVPVATVAGLIEGALGSLDDDDPEQKEKALAALVEALDLIRGE